LLQEAIIGLAIVPWKYSYQNLQERSRLAIHDRCISRGASDNNPQWYVPRSRNEQR